MKSPHHNCDYNFIQQALNFVFRTLLMLTTSLSLFLSLSLSRSTVRIFECILPSKVSFHMVLAYEAYDYHKPYKACGVWHDFHYVIQ